MFIRAVVSLFVLVANTLVQANPEIQFWQTSNGARVYFVPAPELPMLDVQVVFDAGAARDGDSPGVALLTNALLGEGAAGFDSDAIANAFAEVGAQFGNASHRDMAVLTLRSLTEPTALKPALAMFANILTQPDFPQAAFTRLQKQMLIGLQAEQQSPGAMASRAFYQAIYSEHPYATMPSGNEQSVAQLTVPGLIEFYQRYYVSNNATVVLVGAIERVHAEQIAESLVSGLAAGSPAPALPEVMNLGEANNAFIDYPSAQTHIVMGQPGISRDDPDYFPLYVGNHILGGSGLISRLANEVREKRGLSYSVYSYFSPMRAAGPYQFGLQTRNDQAQQALTIMQDTVAEFSEKGPTTAELTAAKQNITGGFPLRIASNSKIAGYLTIIGFYQLPLDYLATFNAKVNAVTIAQIKEAYQRRIALDKMVVIAVGDRPEQ